MEPKKVCLIGLGVITQRYWGGFSECALFRLSAVADINPDAVSRSLYKDYPYYEDYQEMLRREQPDYVIISTPPQTHFEIARYCLEQGVHVVIEKPVTVCLEELDQLISLAKANNLVFKTLFHWHGGLETKAFTSDWDYRKISRIQVSVRDPYCTQEGVILPDRRPLMGAWIDSGVNILSMIRLWTPMDSCQILKTECRRCPETGLPVYAHAELLLDGIPTDLTVDWTQGIDQKESCLFVDGQTVYINHSAQKLSTPTKTVSYAQRPRMDEHYLQLFRQMDEIPNTVFSRRVHEILFKVNKAL